MKKIILISAILILVACGTNTKKPGIDDVTQIYSSFHCGSQSRSAYVEWVSDSMMMERAFSKLSNQFSSSRLPSPDIDFSKQRIAIIHMGQQPTAGYSLHLASKVLNVTEQIIELKLEWSGPDAGLNHAQVLTNPCTVVAIPVLDYKGLIVVDRNNKMRLKIDLHGS